jgi:hypothetical protein
MQLSRLPPGLHWATHDTACGNNALCSSAVSCVAQCKPGGNLDNCIVTCINPSPLYEELLNCFLAICGVDCGEATPLVCNVLDGG